MSTVTAQACTRKSSLFALSVFVCVCFHSPAATIHPEQKLAFICDFSSPFTLLVLSFYLTSM